MAGLDASAFQWIAVFFGIFSLVISSAAHPVASCTADVLLYQGKCPLAGCPHKGIRPVGKKGKQNQGMQDLHLVFSRVACSGIEPYKVFLRRIKVI